MAILSDTTLALLPASPQEPCLVQRAREAQPAHDEQKQCVMSACAPGKSAAAAAVAADAIVVAAATVAAAAIVLLLCCYCVSPRTCRRCQGRSGLVRTA